MAFLAGQTGGHDRRPTLGTAGLPVHGLRPLDAPLSGAPRRRHRAPHGVDDRRGATAAVGYRQLWCVLRRAGHLVNRKRVQRLYQEERLQVRRRRRERRVAVPRQPAPVPTRANERWSMDVVRDTLADGRAFRAWTVVDGCTRECPAIVVDFALPAERVVAALDVLAARRGLPRTIVCDNGSEFTSARLDEWAHWHGVTLDFIEPGKPCRTRSSRASTARSGTSVSTSPGS